MLNHVTSSYIILYLILSRGWELCATLAGQQQRLFWLKRMLKSLNNSRVGALAMQESGKPFRSLDSQQLGCKKDREWLLGEGNGPAGGFKKKTKNPYWYVLARFVLSRGKPVAYLGIAYSTFQWRILVLLAVAKEVLLLWLLICACRPRVFSRI